MRKQTRQIRRSCPMCKPHKMGWTNRWTIKDQARFKLAQQEIKQATLPE